MNLRNEAIATFGDKMVISGLHQQHGENFLPDEDVPAGQLPLKKIKYAYTGDVDTVAETWTFAETDFSILTADSGYAKFRASPSLFPHLSILISSVVSSFSRRLFLLSLPPLQHLSCAASPTLRSLCRDGVTTGTAVSKPPSRGSRNWRKPGTSSVSPFLPPSSQD